MPDGMPPTCRTNWITLYILDTDSSRIQLLASACSRCAVQNTDIKIPGNPAGVRSPNYSSRMRGAAASALICDGGMHSPIPALEYDSHPSCCAAPSPPCTFTSCFCWPRCSTPWQVCPCKRRGTFARRYAACRRPRQRPMAWRLMRQTKPASTQPAESKTRKKHTPPAPGA